jgi:MraZ protein
VAPQLIGTNEHSLDAKGRVILPARFRTVFGPKAFLSKNEERCLALWTTEEFEKKLAEKVQLQTESKTQRNVVRLWAGGSAEVDIDRQGRLAIPSNLREFARLEVESPVLVVGVVDRVEFWNPREWEHSVAPDESELTGDSEPPGGEAPAAEAS